VLIHCISQLKLNQLQKLGLTLAQLKGIVKADPKRRFSLVIEQTNGPQLNYTTVEGNGEGDGVWLIRASQGHSISVRSYQSNNL
jgi:2'-phosphotransferase